MRVLLTGAATGIGRAIAERFHRAGAQVFICDAAPELLDACLREHPGFRGRVSDVADPVQVELLVQDALSQMGGIDVLVNNAGIAGPRAPIEETDYDDFDRTMRINVGGMFYMARNVVPVMKAQGAGCIVNIGTSSARTGLPQRTAYVVSKSAVLGLTLNLARELGPFGIRCNCVLPGAVANERGRNIVSAMAAKRGLSFEAMEAEVLSHISMRSWVEPDEVASMVVFLASEQCAHVSGQMIGVCGHVEWEG